MIDLSSAESIIRAAARCVEVMAARIAADPHNPITADLQLIADMAQKLITDNERRIS